METQLKLSLGSFLSDKEIENLIDSIKQGKIEQLNLPENCLTLIKKIVQQFEVTIILTFKENKSQIFKFN